MSIFQITFRNNGTSGLISMTLVIIHRKWDWIREKKGIILEIFEQGKLGTRFFPRTSNKKSGGKVEFKIRKPHDPPPICACMPPVRNWTLFEPRGVTRTFENFRALIFPFRLTKMRTKKENQRRLNFPKTCRHLFNSSAESCESGVINFSEAIDC